jgi:hypothetical protein
MSIKKFGAALVAVLALTAIAASSASATVSTTAAQWYTGASPGTTLAGETAVTGSPSGTTTLEGEIAGKKVKLSTSTFNCVGCKIKNSAVETAGTATIATGEGQIEYTGVTVVEPTVCTVHTAGVAGDGTIITKPLKIHGDWMDTNTENKHAFLQFIPKTGSVFASLEFTGTNCPIAGPDNVTGTVFGESTNNTGVQAVTQPLKFSAAVQSTTGASLKLGVNAATLTGTATFEAMGESFGIH